MFRVILALALAVGMSSCAWFQGDEEGLEISGEGAAGEAGNNIGNQELGLGQEEGMANESGSFGNQIGGENSSVAAGNPLLNNEEGMAGAAPDANMDGGGGMPAADYLSGEGGVVRYTMGETNVYAQPDSSSAPVRTLGQGEVLLVTISGEFAQSAVGFVAVSDLSAELQPRVFIGNDWH